MSGSENFPNGSKPLPLQRGGAIPLVVHPCLNGGQWGSECGSKELTREAAPPAEERAAGEGRLAPRGAVPVSKDKVRVKREHRREGARALGTSRAEEPGRRR